MRRITKYVTLIVTLHSLILIVHDLAHRVLGIDVSLLQYAYAYLVMGLAPIVSAILLWKGRLRNGAILLFLAMLGSLVFAGVNHFVIVSKDHVSHAPAGKWLPVFQSTAILLAVIEILGCWVGLLILRKSSRTAA